MFDLIVFHMLIPSDILVIVHSKCTPMISWFRFGFSLDQPSVPILCSHPAELIIPDVIKGDSVNGSGVTDIQIRELSVRDEEANDESSLEFFEFAVLDTNLALWRLLVYSEPEVADRAGQSPVISPQNDSAYSVVSQSFIEPDEKERVKVPPTNFRGYFQGEDRFIAGKLKRRDNELERPAMSMKSVYDRLRDLRQPICSNLMRSATGKEESDNESETENGINAMMAVLNQVLTMRVHPAHIGQTL
jgi:hypothetical protein